MSTWVPVPALFLVRPDIARNCEALPYLWSQRRDILLQPRCLPPPRLPQSSPPCPEPTQARPPPSPPEADLASFSPQPCPPCLPPLPKTPSCISSRTSSEPPDCANLPPESSHAAAPVFSREALLHLCHCHPANSSSIRIRHFLQEPSLTPPPTSGLHGCCDGRA